MVRVTVELDNIQKVTSEVMDKSRDTISWRDVMDMMMSTIGSLGIEPSPEAVLEYFGIQLLSVNGEPIDDEDIDDIIDREVGGGNA